jgi:hypothetical protein
LIKQYNNQFAQERFEETFGTNSLLNEWIRLFQFRVSLDEQLAKELWRISGKSFKVTENK